MTPQEILSAVTASPELTTLAASGNTQAIAEALSVGLTQTDKVTKFTSLGIAEKFPSLGGLPGPLAAEAALQGLEGFAAAASGSPDPATKLLGNTIQRQMAHLTNNGMAIGSDAIAAMLAIVVTGGGLTQAQADALVGVAASPVVITAQQVQAAIYNDNGSLKV